MYLIGTNCVLHILKISLLSGVSYPERGYDLFLTAAVADGAKLWDLRQDRIPSRFYQLIVQLCIWEYSAEIFKQSRRLGTE
jgi:hypothetical protein